MKQESITFNAINAELKSRGMSQVEFKKIEAYMKENNKRIVSFSMGDKTVRTVSLDDALDFIASRAKTQAPLTVASMSTYEVMCRMRKLELPATDHEVIAGLRAAGALVREETKANGKLYLRWDAKKAKAYIHSLLAPQPAQAPAPLPVRNVTVDAEALARIEEKLDRLLTAWGI